MRVIKFRAWCQNRKIMMYRTLFDRNWYSSDGRVVCGAMPSDEHELDVMQYAGIMDRNGYGGNGLFKDDLVECWGHGVGRVDQNRWGEWCIFFPERDDGEGPYDIAIQDLVMEKDLGPLVGNIHEPRSY